MKKIFTIICAGLLTFGLSAQDLTSKKGENYLPESGEWSIGFDATSLLNYFGNLFNSNATAPTVTNYFNDNAFYGKKMIDDNTAWRTRVELGFNSISTTTPHMETYIVNGNNVDEWKDDKVTISSFGLNLWLGKEMRRGSTRLQGVYGAEAGLGFSSSGTTNEYGHEVWEDNINGSGRTTEVKDGTVFTLGARAFIGAEYFVLPKMSLSAEYGWGFGLNFGGKGSTTIEETKMDNNGNPYSDSSTSDTGKTSAFRIGNDLRGNLGIHLYF